jgi:hypothetical protein
MVYSDHLDLDQCFCVCGHNIISHELAVDEFEEDRCNAVAYYAIQGESYEASPCYCSKLVMYDLQRS